MHIIIEDQRELRRLALEAFSASIAEAERQHRRSIVLAFICFAVSAVIGVAVVVMS